MFGIVHKAFKSMIISHYGKDKWRSLLANAQQHDESYLRTLTYPDEQLETLVLAAPSALNKPSAELIEEFGHYWYQYTLTEGYRDLLEGTGRTLPEFLHNLNDMHAKVGVMFPGMKAPIFKCRDVTDTSLVLHYYSTREGFGPIVVGAVQAIAKRFETPATVTRLQCVEDGYDHDTYLIEY